MNMLRNWTAVVLLLCASWAGAQERAYKEGTVTVVTSVKVVDGQFENYMRYLAANWRPVNEEAKKAGEIVDYHVYGANPRSPQEPDMYLVVTYPNMAAFDGMDARMEPILAKLTKQTMQQREDASGKRVVMRTILGSEMLRELVFK
ncbi:MAG TPA: hypothetical protein PL007_00175 [Thermomonas sp.]|jgi:hypothetical protein|nr:hypothetical protein [Thermomonas sp.]HQY48764.1 hypothetical protein [Thermomonas sp.]HRA55969.1 hypothetical protein [Thermomonas sp.]